MAFDTLGVNVTASGIKGVASDIARLAGSFLKYVGAVKQADAASVKAAQSQSKLADTMSSKSQKNVAALEKKYSMLITRANSLRVVIDNLNMTMRNPIDAKYNYQKAVAEFKAAEQAANGFAAAMRRHTSGRLVGQFYKADLATLEMLRNTMRSAGLEVAKYAKNYAASNREQDRLMRAVKAFVNVANDARATADDIANAYQDMADASKEAADKQDTLAEANAKFAGGLFETENVLDAVIGMLNDSSGAFSGLTGIVSKLVPGLSSVAGGLGQTSGASATLASTLGISTGALAGIVAGIGAAVLAVGAAVLAFKALKAAVNLAIKVVQVAWQVFKKLVSVVWDVATAIGKVLWNALKKIVGAPFKLISNLFGGIFGSMKRVMEMAIGMNLSRIWWQLGMKIRDMFKTATDAAIEYQVTYTRLSTLMKNEVIGKLGPGASTEEYNAGLVQATRQTKELITWTSKLAVLTIFGAEDILSVYTLAMSYGFASTQAEKLTESVLDFASGMGLGDTEMKRIIENFGQMRAQGKITGTELRDLARGSFVPVNEVLEEMAKNAGLVGDYDVPNMEAISAVLANMAENGELTSDALASVSSMLNKLGADGKITRTEFETLVQDLSKSDVMQKFGLTAEQAGKALEGIKTGKLTAELNDLIKTGKLTIDEFFDAFIEMVTDKYPNAAKSMGLTMKAVKSNIEDYIATMVGWRLIAPVFEVVAKHVQNFIQNTLMNDRQIAMFDRMGKAFKVVTELVMTYSDAMKKARDIAGKMFGTGPFAAVKRFASSLMDIVGALGTEDFQSYFVGFERSLSLLFLPSKSNGLVISGIKNLDQIMKDIMEGVEIDPIALKKSLDDVFGTLWREFFGPKIKEGIELAWSKHIAPAIGRLWQRMKDKFSEWKTDTLIPGIKTFFEETLPGWISGFGAWIAENGPGIITTIGTFVSDLLGALTEASALNLGEDHPLTLLLNLLESIATYATTKIVDPTSDINIENLESVRVNFEKLRDALSDIVKQELLDIPAVKEFVDKWNSPGAQSTLNTFISFFETLKEVAAINYGPLILVLGAITGVSTSGGTIKLSSVSSFLDKLIALAGLAAASGGTTFTFVIALIEAIGNIAASVAQVDWGSGEGFLANVGEFIKIFAEKEIKSTAIENLAKAFDSMLGFVGKLKGVDATSVRSKLREIYNGIREFFGLAPVDFPPLTGEIDLTIDTNVTSNDPNLVIGADGTATYIPVIGYTPPATTTITPEVIIAPHVTMPNGVTADSSNWLDNWLAGNWVGPSAEPLSKDLKSMAVDVSIVPTVDATQAGTDMAVDFSSGFSSTVATEMAAIDMPIPEITVTRRRRAADDAIAMVAEIAAVFNSDTSIASAGSNMMDSLMSAISSKTRFVQKSAAGIAKDLASPLDGLSGTFTSAGANAVQGLWNGMAGVMAGLIRWWIKQVAYLNSIVPTMNQQNSPSRLYRHYGEDMMKGLQLGLESGQEGAVAQMHDAAIELRQALGAINTGTISPQQYNNVSNTTNWNVNVTTPLVASTPIQAYEILRMRAR